MWRQCHTCGWWQKGHRSCEGCSHSSLRSARPSHGMSKPPPRSGAETLTFTVLQDRWHQAKQSSQNPKHVKIEKFCSQCLLRTLGGSSTCRGCRGDLTSGMKILPGQWPPLNCPDHLLQRFEHQGASPAPAAANAGTAGDVQMMGGDSADTDRPMQHLPLSQLRQEKLKLEKHILELPNDGFANLREQLELTLSATIREIDQRKPAGQSLDQALSRHKAAAKAKAAAEEHLQQAEAAEARAQQALQDCQRHRTAGGPGCLPRPSQHCRRGRLRAHQNTSGTSYCGCGHLSDPAECGPLPDTAGCSRADHGIAAASCASGCSEQSASPAWTRSCAHGQRSCHGTTAPCSDASAAPDRATSLHPTNHAGPGGYSQRENCTRTRVRPGTPCAPGLATCRWLLLGSEPQWTASTQWTVSSPAPQASTTRRRSRLRLHLQGRIPCLPPGIQNAGSGKKFARSFPHPAYGLATATGHQSPRRSSCDVGGRRLGGV